MRRACCIVILFLILPFVSSQVDPDDPNPSLSLQQPQPAIGPELIQALSAMEERIAQNVKDYNDENFLVLDQRVAGYISSISVKAVIGILGVNLLVAGAAFFWLNHQNRKLSYESAAQRKRQSDEDREYIIENINIIRDRLDFLEEQAKAQIDSSVIPTEKLDEDIRKQHLDYRSEQEQFDQQLADFVNNRGGGYNGGTGYAQEEAYPARDALEGKYLQEAPGAAAGSEVYGGVEEKRRIAEERFI